MPTFQATIPEHFSNTGDWFLSNPPYEWGLGSVNTSGTLVNHWDPAHLIFASAHGSFPVNNPPVGFRPTTNLKASVYILMNGPNSPDTFICEASGSSSSTPTQLPPLVLSLPDYLSYVLLVSPSITITIENTNNSGFTYRRNLSSISGNYEIFIWTWTLNPVSGSLVSPGDTITIASTGVDALLLDELTIEMGGIPIVPSAQTENLLTFIVPNINGSSSIIATGNGVQFGGTVLLGSLTVLVDSGSGIYFISPGKTNDTIYDRNNPGQSIIVKIPNPFAKTGFIGS